ncbi:MAG: Ig-like domain-containing protein, partial [Myxococcota bacterium]
MRKTTVALTFAALTALLAAGCTDQEFSVGLDQPLRVTATHPGANVQEVARESTVRAVFSEQVRPLSVSSSTFYLELLESSGDQAPDPAAAQALGKVESSVTYEQATMSAVLTPSAPLEHSSWYRAVLTTGIQRDRSPEASLPVDTSWVFRTVDPPALFLVSSSPSAGAMNAARLEDDERPSAVTLVFNEAVDEETLDLQVESYDGGSVRGRLRVDENIVSFRPAEAWSYSAQYRLKIAPGLLSTSGGALEQEVEIVFDTEDPPPLALIQALPFSGGPAGRDEPIVLTFSEGVDQSSVLQALVVRDEETGETIEGSLEFGPVESDEPVGPELIGEDVTVTFTPSAPAGGEENPHILWPYSAEIQVEIGEAAASDRATDGSANPTGHSGGGFSPLTIGFRVEELPELRVIFTSPQASSTGVAPGSSVLVQMDQPVDRTTVDSSTFLVEDLTTGTPLEGSFAFEGGDHSIVFDPNAPFELGHRIGISLGTGLCSAAEAGGGCLGSALSYFFETRETEQLRVAETSPPDGAASVPVGSFI